MWVHTRAPPRPHSQTFATPMLFFPKKSPPSIPFAAVLLKKLGKTTMSRGRGHSWRWRRAKDLSPPVLLLLTNTNPLLEGNSDSLFPSLYNPFGAAVPCFPLLKAPLESTSGPEDDAPKPLIYT